MYSWKSRAIGCVQPGFVEPTKPPYFYQRQESERGVGKGTGTGGGGWVGSLQSTVLSTQFAFETYRFPKAYICTENRMNESAFRNIWARVTFFKFSKLRGPQASAI